MRAEYLIESPRQSQSENAELEALRAELVASRFESEALRVELAQARSESTALQEKMNALADEFELIVEDPLTSKIFADPVVMIPSGTTMDREAAQLVLAQGLKDLMTGGAVTGYVPNNLLKSVMDLYYKRIPGAKEKQAALEKEIQEANNSEKLPLNNAQEIEEKFTPVKTSVVVEGEEMHTITLSVNASEIEAFPPVASVAVRAEEMPELEDRPESRVIKPSAPPVEDEIDSSQETENSFHRILGELEEKAKEHDTELLETLQEDSKNFNSAMKQFLQKNDDNFQLAQQQVQGRERNFQSELQQILQGSSQLALPGVARSPQAFFNQPNDNNAPAPREEVDVNFCWLPCAAIVFPDKNLRSSEIFGEKVAGSYAKALHGDSALDSSSRLKIESTVGLGGDRSQASRFIETLNQGRKLRIGEDFVILKQTSSMGSTIWDDRGDKYKLLNRSVILIFGKTQEEALGASREILRFLSTRNEGNSLSPKLYHLNPMFRDRWLVTACEDLDSLNHKLFEQDHNGSLKIPANELRKRANDLLYELIELIPAQVYEIKKERLPEPEPEQRPEGNKCLVM